MFESAELGHKIDKEQFKAEVPALRQALLEAQFELLEAKHFPVIILVGGVDGAGKGETVNLLNEWMDPRHIQTHSFPDPSDEERERPRMWRFWRALPPKGKIGIFFGHWYTEPIINRVEGHLTEAEMEREINEILRFERMLANEGALIIKFWLHLSKESQRTRLKALEKNPDTRWRVTEIDWERFKHYDKFRRASEHTLRETSSAEAPWIIVEGSDERYRSLTVGKVLLEAIRRRLAHPEFKARRNQAVPVMPQIDQLQVLRSLDLSKAIPKKDYEKKLEKLQGRLNLLSRHERFGEIAVLGVFEGSDAAGKGGSIRRITAALDARHYEVVPFAAPTEEERAQPYLWRFWRHVPRRGRITLFDRSWYGRVLVERVEGFCAEADWLRAYSEINDFEEQLVRERIVVVKFWLAISAEEQLRRFKEREQTGFKRYKITDEDWRNREKWEAYETAVCDMVDRTSTEIAPWTLVESNDKYHARIKVLQTLIEQIEHALET